jgi:hypothetical protein
MANFKACPRFAVHDDYYTRKSTWELVAPYIPKKKVVWEACLLGSNEQSKRHLQELGFDVVGDKTVDIFEQDLGDVIVTNIPFSTELKKRILRRLVELDKPFIIIMNSTNTFSNYFHEIFAGKQLEFIVPKGKIHFDKYVDGEFVPGKDNCSFYSIFVCYKTIKRGVLL